MLKKLIEGVENHSLKCHNRCVTMKKEVVIEYLWEVIHNEEKTDARMDFGFGSDDFGMFCILQS